MIYVLPVVFTLFLLHRTSGRQNDLYARGFFILEFEQQGVLASWNPILFVINTFRMYLLIANLMVFAPKDTYILTDLLQVIQCISVY